MGNIIVAVTKHLTFDASHFLINHDWDIDQNIKAFHACCVYKDSEGIILEPHGHTYHIEVTVKGEVDPDTGFVIDFKELNKILKEGVIARMDHRLINNIPYFVKSKKSPTVENMLYYVWSEICGQINTLRPNLAWLESIRIWETPDSFATLTKDMIMEFADNACDGSCGENCCGGTGIDCCKNNDKEEE
ncbi:MAG: 6-carboxytetrahydropterin synthase [Chloroflexota bacterium]|nr:6-carboxytetrahydropterin synthase [Chloroflexota bacterium]